MSDDVHSHLCLVCCGFGQMPGQCNENVKYAPIIQQDIFSLTCIVVLNIICLR